MKKKLHLLSLLLCSLFLISNAFSQTTIYTEDFEGSDLNGYALGSAVTNTDYASQAFGGTSSDYINRGLANSFNFAGVVTGNSTNMLVLEDIDGAGLGYNGESYLELDPINILGTTGMTIDIDVAFPNPVAIRYEASKYLIVDYSIDGGSYNTVLAFYGGNGLPGMARDTDLDGTTDGVQVNTAVTSFTVDLDAIAGSCVFCSY